MIINKFDFNQMNMYIYIVLYFYRIELGKARLQSLSTLLTLLYGAFT